MTAAKPQAQPVQGVIRSLKNPWGVSLSLLVSPVGEKHLGGNKYCKLSGYLEAARSRGSDHLITMTGAHSNHLRAFAALARREGLKATAVIRGEELADEKRQSDTIRWARAQGTHCIFVSRGDYRLLREAHTDSDRAALVPGVNFSGGIFIPEGGAGAEGAAGVIPWAMAARGFDMIYLPVATATTAAGFLRATQAPSQVRGVAVLRNKEQVMATIRQLAPDDYQRFGLVTEFSAGFGKVTEEIKLSAAQFSALWDIQIDGVYMVKAALALAAAARAGQLTGRVLLVYTYNE